MNNSRRRIRTTQAPGARLIVSQDIITDILSRLPIKSITRFGCVSKPWCNLIKSQDFVTTHLHRSTRNPSLLIRSYHNPTGSGYGFRLLLDEAKLYDLKSPFAGGLLRFPKIVGSCNGIVCLDISRCFASSLVLWNIALRQSNHLPKPLITDKGKSFWMVSLGFGFSCDIDDYKLVRIVYFEVKCEDDLPLARVEVYARSTGIWNEIDVDLGSCVISGSQEALAVKGMLHWMAIGVKKLANCNFIVSFDMGDESFKKRSMPVSARGNHLKLVEYKESLAVAIYPGGENGFNRFELWILNMFDGDEECWTIRFRVEPFPKLVSPVGIWKGCEILFKSLEGKGNNLILHNLGNQESRYLFIDDGEYTSEVCNYVESLVSVSGGNRVVEESHL